MSKRERVLGWIENECKRWGSKKGEREKDRDEKRREGEKSGRLLGA